MATGYFVWYTKGMSFTMKALAAAALELHWNNIMVMLWLLWLCYGCCYSFCVNQERGCSHCLLNPG